MVADPLDRLKHDHQVHVGSTKTVHSEAALGIHLVVVDNQQIHAGLCGSVRRLAATSTGRAAGEWRSTDLTRRRREVERYFCLRASPRNRAAERAQHPESAARWMEAAREIPGC